MGQQPLDCPKCQELREMLEQAETANAELSARSHLREQELVAAAEEEMTGLQMQLRRAARAEAKARSDLSWTLEEGPLAERVQGVLRHWQTATGHKRSSVALNTDRAKLAIQMLRKHKGEEPLIEAISGVALFPYMRFGKRYATGNRDELKSHLEDCIGSEKKIDQNRELFRQASMVPGDGAQAIAAAFWQVNAEEKMWGRLWMDAMAAVEAGVEPGEPLEEFLRKQRAGQGWQGMAA